MKSNFLVERVQFEGAKLNITLLVILSYMFGIRSNMLLLLWLGSAIFGRWIMDKVYKERDPGKAGFHAASCSLAFTFDAATTSFL